MLAAKPGFLNIHVLCAIWAACAWISLPGAARCESLETLEALVGQWSDLRLAISGEERGWRNQEAQTRVEIVLLQKEKTALQDKIDKATDALASVEADRLKSLKDKERLSEMLQGLPPLLDAAESALRSWPDRLPAPLRESLESAFHPLTQKRGVATTLSDSARLQRIVALYTEIEKLHHDIHVLKEVLTMPDDSRREVDVLYLGLARAFAVSTDNAWAAVGTPLGKGWHWETRENIADPVRRAISIYKREEPAAFVVLPLAIRGARE